MDYVTEIRIQRVKELLGNRSLTVSQIAKQVGYANDIGLIRVFKKWEGITPGAFREHMLTHSSDGRVGEDG